MTREELLRAVAEAWPRATYHCPDRLQPSACTMLRYGKGLHKTLTLSDDLSDAPAMVLMLDEMEKRGHAVTLSDRRFNPGTLAHERWFCYAGQVYHSACGPTRAWAVAEAFVAVMQTCQSEDVTLTT